MTCAPNDITNDFFCKNSHYQFIGTTIVCKQMGIIYIHSFEAGNCVKITEAEEMTLKLAVRRTLRLYTPYNTDADLTDFRTIEPLDD